MSEPIGFIAIDFFTGFEAAHYVGKAAILQADITEAEAGTKGWIPRRAHIGGGAYEIYWQPEGTLKRVRLNRTRFLKFFRLMSGTEVEAWKEKPLVVALVGANEQLQQLVSEPGNQATDRLLDQADALITEMQDSRKQCFKPWCGVDGKLCVDCA